MSIRGWVCVITNKAMPDLVKVGYSTKDPTLRARELDNTGAPHPYEVVFDMLVLEPREVEQRVHSALAAHREGKEWFRCSVAAAVAQIKAIGIGAADNGYIDVPDEPSAVPPRASFEATGTNDKCILSAYGCKLAATRRFAGYPYCEPHYDEVSRAETSGSAGARSASRWDLARERLAREVEENKRKR